jgi:hypothetical protein
MNTKKLSQEEARERVSKLRGERKLLEVHLLNTKRQMPLWLSLRYTFCRKGGCKCTRGEPHGPFYYAAFKEQGRICYRYLPRDKLASVKPAAESYRKYSEKLARLNHINREIEEILRDWRRANLAPIPQWLKKKKTPARD